ncbi:MAG: PQQ-binding-like beta-propeller repeat protein, partial [Planctomycetaceae bacterium]|nr:PQQ-binding-like beta-propeller repeat protein [Planctomycetaceae bacterium]
MRRRSRTIAIVFLFGLRVLCQPDVVFAQVPGIFPQRQFEAPVQAMRDNVQQRQLQQALSEITEALEGNNWVQAASLFDSAWSRICSGEDPILEENSTDGQPIVREGTRTDAGGRSRMEDVYQTAPAEFRKEYLTQFSSVANQALTDATVHGGPPALRQVAARYRFTNAGAVATRQLARLAIERADYLDAALQLDLLKRMSAGESQPGGQQTLQIQLAVAQWMAGLEFDAISELKTLASTSGDQPVRMAFAGKDILLPPVDGDYRGLLERISAGRISSRPRPSAAETSWLQPGGDYRRSAIQSTGPIDLKPRWTASLSEVADVLFADRLNPLLGRVREYIDQFVVRFQQGNATVPPNSLPLLADDLLVFRTMAGLRAVDVTTGELIWESSLPDGRIRAAMDRLQETSEVAGEEITPTPRSLFVPNASRFESSDSTIESMAGGLAFQLFSQMVRTNTATQLSSDGSTVYAIEDSGWLTWPGQLDFDGTSGETQTNYLRAYDLKSGVRRWEAGGQAAGSGRANVLAGYYFLGAPLVLGSRIYVIAENSEGIFLLQLGEPEFQSSSPASANPRIIRSQLLTIPEFPLTRHPVRKHAGMTPSFAQGLLICPTTDQQVIAVSVADHSIRWVYRYQDIIRMPELGYQVPVLAGSLSPQHSDQLDFDSRWTDTLPRIHGDTVVLTPRDDDKMYCLDLQTGRELWRTGRGLVRSVVAITDDLIIATGNRVVMGIARNTGKLVWVQEIHDAVVSGIASTDGSVVHVPTTSPSIISYEISTGRRLLTRRLRSSQPVGNLLVRKDRIIDQTLTSVRCFSSDPADADAPLLEAQAALLDGDFEKGIQILDQLVLQFESNQALTTEDAESVRRAKVTAQSAQTVFTDVLMESLRVDFIRNRQHIPRLRQLIQQTSIDQVQAMSVLATMLNMDLTDAAVLPDQLKDLDKAGSQMDQLFELMVDGLLEMKERPVSELVDAVAELLPELRSGSNHVYVQGYLTRQNSQVLAAGIKRVLMSRTEQDRHIIEARLVERTKQILDQSALSTTETLQMIRDCDASGLHAVARQLLDSLDSSPADPVVFAAVNATREQMNLRSITTGNGEAARALVDLLQTWNQNGNFSALRALIADLKSADGFNPSAALKFHAHQEAQVTFDQWVTQHPLPGSPSIWPPGTDGVPKVVASDERSMLPQPSPVLDGPQLMIPIFGAPGIYRGC